MLIALGSFNFWVEPVSFFSKLPPASLPPTAPVLAGKFWFLIVLSVSIEIECSVLCK
ncbi:hypothetical protein SLEP1_g14699 [Rubroshorea leprosula]|uniref:Uncharacterized protein n=1 Tax=Rubroshorea leprosula TaxID=152421 RepID=A0AAV5IJX7_9ROSI|nr:hypothetical protein SLEP1_g14699 [Rubroshorea leprosula]